MQLMNELKEQRQHVDMLDAALSKAQADVARLQEEVIHNLILCVNLCKDLSDCMDTVQWIINSEHLIIVS